MKKNEENEKNGEWIFLEQKAEIHVFVTSIFQWRLVMFLSCVLVSPESFPVDSTRVVFGQHSMNCVSLLITAWSCAVVVAQCSVYCAGIAQHIRCFLFFLFPCDSSSCPQDCVFLT